MRRFFYMARFLWLVTPLPPLMAPAMLAAGAIAVVAIAVNPDRAAGALTPLLLLQMFAASSGFMIPARRGHYDLLLTGGFGRNQIAVMHWCVSVLPGVALHLAVAGLSMVLGAGEAASVRGTGAFLALALVSTVPWAATVALPRFTAAIAWLLAIAMVAALLGGDASLLLDPLDGRLPDSLVAVVLTLNPVTLVGIEATSASRAALMPAAIVAAGSMAAATAWLSRQDVPLEAAQ